MHGPVGFRLSLFAPLIRHDRKGAWPGGLERPLHYLLIIAHDDTFAPTERLVTEIRDWVTAMEARGVRVHGNPLRPASEAVTVQVREGEARRKHGPFSRSREQMCAYELIQCAGLGVAAEVAASHPMAAAATIEVRPVWGQLAG